MNRESRVVIGLDVGSERIGVARGDTGVKIASPLEFIANDQLVFKAIRDLVDRESASELVVGLPRNSNGEETAQSSFVRKFADDLSASTGLSVKFQDESLTSVVAEQRLRSRKDFTESMLRDGTLDSEAAVIILNDFLERS